MDRVRNAFVNTVMLTKYKSLPNLCLQLTNRLPQGLFTCFESFLIHKVSFVTKDVHYTIYTLASDFKNCRHFLNREPVAPSITFSFNILGISFLVQQTLDVFIDMSLKMYSTITLLCV